MKNLFNEINKNHPSIKFDQKYSKSEWKLLDSLFYKDEQQRLQTTPFNKKTDRQSYFHAKLNIPVSLKKSVPCSQILRVKFFFQQNSESECNCKVLKEWFTKRDYNVPLIETEIKKMILLTLSAAGLFKYVWPFCYHQALKG